MEIVFAPYFESLIQSVNERISSELRDSKNLDWAIKRLHFHFEDAKSARFQKYYFQILGNKERFLNDPDFFKNFKRQYSLQGIDNEYLNILGAAKSSIFKLIEERKLSQLYLEYFAKAKIKHGDTRKKRDLASFFTKLVHTFLPDEYCALDNPIKNYFGLKNEGFFVSFLIISSAYKQWLKVNAQIISTIKNKLITFDENNVLLVDKLTDIKILDLIFGVEANHDKGC